MVKKFTFLYLIFYNLIGFTIVSCSKEEALPITADFQVNYLDNNQSIPAKVKITNLTKGADTFHWTFEGSETANSDSQNPGTITYLNPGVFSIKLEASNRDGIYEAKTIEVTIYSALSIDFEAEIVGNNFPPATFNFINLSEGATNSSWHFQGGNPETSTDINPQGIVFEEPGTHTVTLQISNGNSSLQLEKTIEVAPHLVANFSTNVSYEDADMQAPVTLQLVNESVSATQFSWTMNGATPVTSSLENPEIMFTTPGNYTITLTASNGKESETAQQNVEIFENTNLRTTENLTLGINTAHIGNIIPAFFSTKTGEKYFSSEVNITNAPIIDIVYYGLNHTFDYNKFVSPDMLGTNTNFNTIPYAHHTKFINVLESCNCSASMSVAEFDNLTNGTQLEDILVEETESGSQYFDNAVVPRIVLFETAEGKKGAIKIKDFIDNGTSSYIIVDIKVQKE